jgi:hypothetical protein
VDPEGGLEVEGTEYPTFMFTKATNRRPEMAAASPTTYEPWRGMEKLRR